MYCLYHIINAVGLQDVEKEDMKVIRLKNPDPQKEFRMLNRSVLCYNI